MKKILLLILIVTIVFGVISWHNNSPVLILGKLLKKGEIYSGELHYRLYLFGIIPVGEAFFSRITEETYNGKQMLHLSARAVNLKSVSAFFSGSATLNSYIDKKTFAPDFFSQKILIGGKKEYGKDVFYSQDEGVLTILGVKRQMPSGTHDPLSVIYTIRKMDLAKTKSFEFNLNSNQKNYTLKGNSRSQNILLGGKKFDAYLLESTINRKEKNPYHKSNVSMVLLSGYENAPVFIKVFASGFLLTVRLIETK